MSDEKEQGQSVELSDAGMWYAHQLSAILMDVLFQTGTDTAEIRTRLDPPFHDFELTMKIENMSKTENTQNH